MNDISGFIAFLMVSVLCSCVSVESSYMFSPDPGFRHVRGLQLASIISWIHVVVDNETLRMGDIDQRIQH
jgi:hypothetical protein